MGYRLILMIFYCFTDTLVLIRETGEIQGVVSGKDGTKNGSLRLGRTKVVYGKYIQI